jgi:hypothetical protein
MAKATDPAKEKVVIVGSFTAIQQKILSEQQKHWEKLTPMERLILDQLAEAARNLTEIRRSM